jgi:hypothetical protein
MQLCKQCLREHNLAALAATSFRPVIALAAIYVTFVLLHPFTAFFSLGMSCHTAQTPKVFENLYPIKYFIEQENIDKSD